MSLNDNGKPSERMGRKAKGSKARKSQDSLATETGFICEEKAFKVEKCLASLVNSQGN